MKIRNANLSLLILSSLVVLSFAFFVGAEERSTTANNIFLDSDQDGLTDQEEKAYGTDARNPDSDGDSYSDGAEIKAGYDPTKPAPGDRIISAETKDSGAVLAETDSKENMTLEVAEKISEITTSSDQETQEVSLEEIQALVDDALNTTVSEDDFPEVKIEDIKIKKQNYSNLSDEKALAKRKEDFLNYIIAIYYIMSSNSPEPITSINDASSFATQIASQITAAISSRDTSSLEDLSQSGERMLEQMKEVEVPEELVDIHIKALRFSMYAITLRDDLQSVQEDPLAEIAKLSKITAFLNVSANFFTDVATKFSEYGIEYDNSIKEMLEEKGLFAPTEE